ncbi:MAG TPA: cytochrome P450 [Pseudolysinimonas sp.]|nr:cytochrome P450 [Pseudolysinimonas sp.]
MSTREAPILNDVTFEELDSDPYPHYAKWRKESPVAFLPVTESWVVTRWDDCENVAQDETQFATFGGPTEDLIGPNVLTAADPHPHRWMRDALDLTLRPKAVNSYIERMARPAARAYVEDIAAQGSADATADLLEKISVRVVGDVLGVTDVDVDTRQRWFHELFATLMAATFNEEGAGAEQKREKAEAARGEADSYLVRAVERVTKTPDDSPISHLVHSPTADGKPRTYDEVRGTLFVFIMGGFQEPGHGAAASLYGLLSEPEQADAVRADPTLMSAAVHEGLRWLSPFGMTPRLAAVDIKIGDVVIPAGGTLNLVLASANRDESRHENAEKFDVFRPRLPVASFGYGAHFCAGHFLARELEKIALEEVFRGLPNLRLDPNTAPDIAGVENRAVKSLPVVWDAP